MSHHDQQNLSAYLDHELLADDHAAVEAHLATCEDCRRTLEELARVKSAASALDSRFPVPAGLWEGIEQRIAAAPSRVAAPRVVALPRRPRRRLPLVTSVLATAAAAALVVATTLWVVRDRLTPLPRTNTPLAQAPSATVEPAGLGSIEGQVADLERTLAAGRDQLDPATVQTLEASLATIRSAIAEARVALERDPANPELRDYLAVSMQRKVDFMKRAFALAGA